MTPNMTPLVPCSVVLVFVFDCMYYPDSANDICATFSSGRCSFVQSKSQPFMKIYSDHISTGLCPGSQTGRNLWHC